MIRAVFLGTPQAAVPTLRALNDVAEVAAVITRPDKPRGRSGRPQPSAVKHEAGELGLTVLQPETGAALEEALAGLGELHVGVVVAFGMILSPRALGIPHRGFLNVHFSLLPRWRGAAPVERALLAGDQSTGVSLIEMDEGLDTGSIVAARRVSIDPEETAGELTERLAVTGARLVAENLERFAAGDVTPVPQSQRGVTYARRLDPHEAELSAATPASQLLAAIRAFSPRPGARLAHDGRTIKVWRAIPADRVDLAPGCLAFDGRHLLMGTADRAVELLEVQPPGRRRMSGAAWARGLHGSLGGFA